MNLLGAALGVAVGVWFLLEPTLGGDLNSIVVAVNFGSAVANALSALKPER